MKKIFLVYVEDDNCGEVEGMFSEDGTMLGTWCCNDASWRTEYFDGFMEALNIKVEYSNDSKFKKTLIDHWTN